MTHDNERDIQHEEAPEGAPPAEADATPAEIDASALTLGEWLRQSRQRLGFSLQEAEVHTRIRVRYLQALEDEEIAALPDPVVGRGFLRNYAAYLDIDVKEANRRYSALVGAPLPEPQVDEDVSPFHNTLFQPVALHPIDRGRSRLWVGVPIALAMLAALLLAWWAYPRYSAWIPWAWNQAATFLAGGEPTPEPVPELATKTSASPALATVTRTATGTATTAPARTATEPPGAGTATPTLEITLTPTHTPSPSPTMTPTLTPSPVIYTGIFLELHFLDLSWIQVTVDGVRQFQGEVEAGEYMSWYGEDRIEVRVGNAGGVEVTVNGEKLGPLGEPGEVVDQVFEKVGDGVGGATMTPEITGQPTAAPQSLSPTPTLVPTLALTPTPTVTSTASP